MWVSQTLASQIFSGGIAFASSEDVIALQNADGLAFGGFIFSYTSIVLIALSLITLMITSSGWLQREVFNRAFRLPQAVKIFVKTRLFILGGDGKPFDEMPIILRDLSVRSAGFISSQKLIQGTHVLIALDVSNIEAVVKKAKKVSKEDFLIQVEFLPLQNNVQEKVLRYLDTFDSAA